MKTEKLININIQTTSYANNKTLRNPKSIPFSFHRNKNRHNMELYRDTKEQKHLSLPQATIQTKQETPTETTPQPKHTNMTHRHILHNNLGEKQK